MHGFGQKLRFLKRFFLGKMCREKLFSDVLDIIIAFLDYKNMNTNKSQNLHFSKWVSPWFWSKIGHFFDFLFRQNRPRKTV